ncbi:MAG: methyltransferase domain-containing protein [Candidatus Wildermuthbacteria bacterium]|nr:methyltransferase domain-containing protein [Candidatus Wildermuthbacteria bacterium]
MGLVKNLQEQGILKTPRIVEAFNQIARKDFLPRELAELSEVDEAFPIGWGQTISQPSVVAFMIEQLQPQKGEKILDIGAGSGWTTALLASIVGEKGKVVAIDIVPAICEFGTQNIAKYSFLAKGAAKYVCQDGEDGYKKEAPFDNILVSAALQAKELPLAWKEQLKTGGKIVVPIGDSIWVFQKKNDAEYEETEYPGFVFVPFV